MVQVKYTGRIAITIFVIVSYLAMWGIGNQPISSFRLVALVFFCIMGWWLGKQYDMAKFYAEKDVLTNVYNRRVVEIITPKLLALAERNKKQLAVFIIDIDNFKLINDSYGHDFGDKILKGVSDTLVKSTRKSDIVIRWGGDEILIIAPFINIKSSKLIIQRIENELKKFSQQMGVKVSLSIGTAHYPDDGTSIHEIIKVADRNMYKLKISKKDFCEASEQVLFNN